VSALPSYVLLYSGVLDGRGSLFFRPIGNYCYVFVISRVKSIAWPTASGFFLRLSSSA
jgi:hypothetical protein